MDHPKVVSMIPSCFYFQPPFCRGLLHTCRNFGANRVARVAAGHTQRRFETTGGVEMVDGGI